MNQVFFSEQWYCNSSLPFSLFLLFCALLNGVVKLMTNFHSLACEFLVSFTSSSILAMHCLIGLVFCRKIK